MGGVLGLGEGGSHEVEVVGGEILGHGGIVVVRAVGAIGGLRFAPLRGAMPVGGPHRENWPALHCRTRFTQVGYSSGVSPPPPWPEVVPSRPGDHRCDAAVPV